MLYSKIEGEGKPFLIIHGFLGMSDNWKTLGLQFAQLGFQIHLLDMRNHGKSFHSDEFNYEIMVEDVKTYIDFHNLQDITLLGHSMGGKIAMLFATLYPEVVEKLIIVDYKGEPTLAYATDNGERTIPIGEINCRPDGIMYGGSWKLELSIHDGFADCCKEHDK